MEKSWMSKPRTSDEYHEGCEAFLDFAFARAARGNQIACPCIDCNNDCWLGRNTVFEHLVCRGFTPNYTVFQFHGETDIQPTYQCEDFPGCNNERRILYDTDGLLNDAFRSDDNGPDEKTKEFYRLLKESQQELYENCKDFSKLSATIRLYLIKCVHGWSDASFDALLSLLVEMFPFAKLPTSFRAAKRMISDLGLDYQKIDACPNDCTLYWRENKDKESCSKCGLGRWKECGNDVEGNEVDEEVVPTPQARKIPQKILRYFPLIPRLQRLFMSSKTAASMTWHHEHHERIDEDGNLEHPADGEAWKDFDERHPSFSSDPRNVRLALSSDGFNPFKTMRSPHSTWPVVLMCYNLPPSMCLKPEYFMLSMIIPGKSAPGNDIDVYLQPLIEELKILWSVGVSTFDASTGDMFQMFAALMWTISDLPGLSVLCGHSSKGELACPICSYDTCSLYLYNSRKMCYMGHRRFLEEGHRWRRDKASFDGTIETRSAPQPWTGTKILDHLHEFVNDFGKVKNKKKVAGPWKKKSIFFELPYWEHNLLRHCLDVMHIEKNFFDNIVATLLEMGKKCKDHLNARLDLQHLGIKRKMHPKLNTTRPRNSRGSKSKEFDIPPACFKMTNAEKVMFCSVLKKAKLPDGFSSNIASCVNVAERKLAGYKSHDAHIMLHYLLQVAVRKTLPKHVALPLIKVCAFFRSLCSKVIRVDELDQLQSSIAEILCQFEKLFPPSFFDIMIHLPIHLTNKVRLGGPVQFRWMYSIERYLYKLKSYVRNRSQPEGSISEGYLAEEALNFSSRYLTENVDSKFIRRPRNFTNGTREETSQILFPFKGRPLGVRKNSNGKLLELDKQTLDRAHRYILFNCDEVQDYIHEHSSLVDNQSRKRNRSWNRAQTHSRDFSEWFRLKVQEVDVPAHIRHLAAGPNSVVQKFYGYMINGFRFHTKEREARLKTQNSGVTLMALTPSFASSRDNNPVMANVAYYGSIREILKLTYAGRYHVVLFKCDWYVTEVDSYGLPRVNLKRLISLDDPFVIATQVQQVFYVQDATEVDWFYVMKTLPRGYMVEQFDEIQNDAPLTSDLNVSIAFEDITENDLIKTDVVATTVTVPADESENDEVEATTIFEEGQDGQDVQSD